MPDWIRGIDDRGRVFTFGIDGNRLRLFFPNESGEVFTYSPGGGSGSVAFGGTQIRYASLDFTANDLDSLCHKYLIDRHVKAQLAPGQYCPRMYRGPETPHPKDLGLLDAWVSTVRSSRVLFGRLRDIFQVVEPDATHDNVYGHELRQLLILACTEVESAWKAILIANHFLDAPANDRWTTGHYIRLSAPMELSAYAVSLSTHPAYGAIEPFRTWDPARPTQSLTWYDAHNAVKHDKEGMLKKATLRCVIEAVAALFVMRIAQFGPTELDHESYFHADEFKLDREPLKLEDWYIRPLPDPAQDPPVWPTGWNACDCPL
jgi:hypothetical protein